MRQTRWRTTNRCCRRGEVMESFRHRVRTPSPAMIVALLALFVALSGGAAAGTYVAAKELGPRSTSVEAGRARILNLVAARVAYLRTHPAGVHQLQRCCPGPRGRRGPRGPRLPWPAGGERTHDPHQQKRAYRSHVRLWRWRL